MSYGPYKLSTFQSDKIFTLDKNEYFYKFNDEEAKDWYQATTIQYDCVKEPATRLEMFLNGKLDVNGLNKDYIKEYASSDYTYYDEGDSVFAMAFNPDLEALKTAQEAAGANINKTILTIKDFRIAMSLAMNRSEFVLAANPTSSPAFALYGSQIVADPEEGLFYRTTDTAKQVVVDFWGLADEIGEGKLYATVDDAIDSITGYNLEMAREYFDKAYDQAIEAGLMTENDTVLIMVGTPNATSAFYNSGYDFIVNNYTEAVKGTKLEGKLTFKRDATLGNGFGTALRSRSRASALME
jgi:oligopeptide transport system substrate-binding protein